MNGRLESSETSGEQNQPSRFYLPKWNRYIEFNHVIRRRIVFIKIQIYLPTWSLIRAKKYGKSVNSISSSTNKQRQKDLVVFFCWNQLQLIILRLLRDWLLKATCANSRPVFTTQGPSPHRENRNISVHLYSSTASPLCFVEYLD